MPSNPHHAKIINLIGGPGCGKTTVAAGIFYRLKLKGVNVEYVQEYAKKLVWLERWDDLNNQYSVSRKQYDVLKALDDKVDVIITDGPLVHGFYYVKYNKDNVSSKKKTKESIRRWVNEFDNENYFLDRGDYPYETEGRYQTEKEAKEVDEEIFLSLICEDIEIKRVISNSKTAKMIANKILEEMQNS